MSLLSLLSLFLLQIASPVVPPVVPPVDSLADAPADSLVAVPIVPLVPPVEEPEGPPVDSLLNLDIQETIARIERTPIRVLLHDIGDWFLHFMLKWLLCLAVFWIAKKLINFVSELLRRWMDRRRDDRTVSHFMINLMRVICWIFVLWILVSILKVDTASILALFASAGLAFGLALSGTLQNFAGGVMILLFKPFRTGDYIFSQGEEGTVEDITIINTVLVTPDNRTVYLPNGATFTGIVRNTTDRRIRRVEWTYSIGYANDYDQAKGLLLSLITADSRILSDPAPFIALSRLGQSSVDIVVRVWVKTPDFWGVFYDLNEAVYRTFPANALGQPSPQMDVYLYQPPDPTANPSVSASRQTASEVMAEAKTDLIHSKHHCDPSAKPSGGESGGA